MIIYDLNENASITIGVLSMVAPWEITLTTGNRRVLRFVSTDTDHVTINGDGTATITFVGKTMGPGVVAYAILDALKMYDTGVTDVEIRRAGSHGRHSGRYGGTGDYGDLSNKPKINNVELSGNMSSDDLNIINVED